ncbi:hypothetical protein GCM10012275_26380 [Longimycelium tulufanense]|uniref:DJ-1/PfpI domain-containing protein n=1 Tax=Longimycelium tulufanense TaxID=907463 RepID=A0A8J3FWL2_9PSEU|nr:DJ-1/PfpI family protein [Longimycelium tulufanense]GGM53947.1 hypothetical protein GCM10012275_26380 [Longimycelium tulufanense]
MTARVVVLAYPGVDELDLFGAFAVLAKAATVGAAGAGDDGPALAVRLAAATSPVTASAGTTFDVGMGLDALAGAAAVVVPGGRGASDASADSRLLAALRMAAAGGTHVYSVCSGAFVVAAAGLAEGRHIAVHHAKRAQLTGVGEVVAGLVRDGDLCSVGGDPAPSVKSVDLAFQVLADLAPDLVEPVSARTEIQPGRTPAEVPR